MLKGIKILLLGLLLVIGAAFLAATFMIDSIVSSNIEQIGSNMTGTSVTVEGVSISPFSGSGTVEGFRVANPDGYSEAYALELEDFSIELEPFSLFSDEVVVNQITISGATVYVEQKLPENNIREIMNHLNSLPDSEASDTRLVIEYFVLENGSANLYTKVGGERSASVDFSKIELRDLGRASGQETTEAVIKQIAEEVAGESLEAAAGSGLEQLKDAVRGLFN
jgi:uncharacterized protein involved in outer membrane biogenesis